MGSHLIKVSFNHIMEWDVLTILTGKISTTLLVGFEHCGRFSM